LPQGASDIVTPLVRRDISSPNDRKFDDYDDDDEEDNPDYNPNY